MVIYYDFLIDAMNLQAITHLTLLRAAGEDTATFLQGQITCDIRDVSSERGCFGAICNAKGRVRSTFVVWRDAEAYWLILPASLRDMIQQVLQKYILRAKVQLAPGDEIYRLYEARHASVTDDTTAHFTVQRREAMWVMRWPSAAAGITRELCLVPAQTSPKTIDARGTETDDALARDIAAGLPWLNSATTEQFIPQMLGLETWRGISFNKGCYTGQEVVARAHYLGEVKRRLHRFVVEGIDEVAPGTDVVDVETGEIAGQVLSAQSLAGHVQGLAVLHISAEGKTLGLPSPNQAKITLTAP